MAHNSGFEIRSYGMMAETQEKLIPLGKWIKENIPARVRPAGEVISYGNYNAALAGYIIERVSGMSYAEYIERNILAPLGMSHTSSRQPLPGPLSMDLAEGYFYINGKYEKTPFEVFNPSPAGSISSTVMDVSRFMIAHLNDGKYENASILQPATAQLMHAQSFSHDPRLNGWPMVSWRWT